MRWSKTSSQFLNAEVSECALKMKRAQVDQLPVVNGNRRLVAMLFDRELIKVLLPERQGSRKD